MAQTLQVELWFSFNSLAIHVLSIPIAECERYAVNPLKWVRFLGYAIYGQQGHLSISNAGPAIDDYLAEIEARPYYFISQDEPRFVDVEAMDDRTSDASVVTNRRAYFGTRVSQRDVACVVTGDGVWNCDACHLLPHSKGDDYISKVIHRRGGVDYPQDIQTVNDPRNGLLLSALLHRRFGQGDLAFLKTPNFALTVNDIPFIPSGQADAATPATRLTLHRFANATVFGPTLSHIALHNSDAREPQDTDEWPPALIFDYIYAAAVLRAWDRQDFIDYAQGQTRASYYKNIEREDEDDNNQPLGPALGHTGAAEASTSAPAPQHDTSLASRGPIQPIGQQKARRLHEIMDVVLGLWMHSSRKDEPKPETGASDSARNDDISVWLQSVEEARDHNDA